MEKHLRKNPLQGGTFYDKLQRSTYVFLMGRCLPSFAKPALLAKQLLPAAVGPSWCLKRDACPHLSGCKTALAFQYLHQYLVLVQLLQDDLRVVVSEEVHRSRKAIQKHIKQAALHMRDFCTDANDSPVSAP